jgi:hypothetical protein
MFSRIISHMQADSLFQISHSWNLGKWAGKTASVSVIAMLTKNYSSNCGAIREGTLVRVLFEEENWSIVAVEESKLIPLRIPVVHDILQDENGEIQLSIPNSFLNLKPMTLKWQEDKFLLSISFDYLIN